MTPNPYLLAADNPAALLALLHDNPSLASCQDEHGYSLVHAAASYNHLDLLRSLVQEFNVPVDLRDEDGETALFVVETVDAAKVLVEELALNPNIKNNEGLTAREKIHIEAEWPDVADFFIQHEVGTPNGTGNTTIVGGAAGVDLTVAAPELAPAPEGLKVTVGTMDELGEAGEEIDTEFRRRIEDLAARGDFHTPEGQARLRRLVEDAIADQGLSGERSVRPRND